MTEQPSEKPPIAPITATHAEIFERFIFKPMREGGLAARNRAIAQYLEQLKLKPVYLQEHNPEFAAMRERLNTRPGLAIPNHPGHFDDFLFFNVLTRQDFAVMVNPNAYKFFCAVLGEERVLEIRTTPGELRGQMRRAQSHIEGGGLLYLHPTGGDDAIYSPKAKDGLVFRDGVRFIMKHVLQPTDMVYSFWFDRSDIAKAAEERITPETNGPAIRDKDRILTTVGIDQPTPIKIDEQYSTAADWQKLIATEPDRAAARRVLARHFQDQFAQKPE